MTARRWTRPQVRPGGRYHAAGMVLVVERVDALPFRDVTARDARRSGFASRDELAAELRADDDTPVYRIAFRAEQPPPARKPPRPTETVLADIAARLERMDARSDGRPWTATALRLIAEHPGRRAADLAGEAGMEHPAFKASVRKLKALGLTESLEVGYRLTPLGRAYARRLRGP